jgi:hypothetical protein
VNANQVSVVYSGVCVLVIAQHTRRYRWSWPSYTTLPQQAYAPLIDIGRMSLHISVFAAQQCTAGTRTSVPSLSSRRVFRAQHFPPAGCLTGHPGRKGTAFVHVADPYISARHAPLVYCRFVVRIDHICRLAFLFWRASWPSLSTKCPYVKRKVLE